MMRSLKNWTGMSSLNLSLGVALMLLAFPILLVVLALLSLVLYALSWMRRILTIPRRYLSSRVDELVAKAIESSLRK